MSDLKTSTIVLPGIINAALRRGVDIQGILRDLGIQVDLANITRTTIDLTTVHAVVTAVEKAAGYPAMGLTAGADFDFEFLPHLKTYCMSASTLREAYETTRQARQLISPLLTFHLTESGDEAVLKLRPDPVLSDEDDRHFTEMVFATVSTLVSRLLKRGQPPRSVRFRHGRTEIRPLYEDFFQCPVLLGAPENAVVYDRQLMDEPLPGGFPEIRRQAREIVERQTADSPLQAGVARRLRDLLKQRRELLAAPVGQVARLLNISPRTLQRRLFREKTSLGEIRDRIRFQAAAEALKSSGASIEEIGEAMGFSDRHSFTRAFQRWAGVSPSAYRKKQSPARP
ncbi:MAG: helix-turn-helix domain-containing protein [Thermodesulfobacteriota bacterium]